MFGRVREDLPPRSMGLAALLRRIEVMRLVARNLGEAGEMVRARGPTRSVDRGQHMYRSSRDQMLMLCGMRLGSR